MKISTSMWKSEHILSSRVLHVIHICYSPAGRSVLGETVHEVLSTARDRRPRAVLRPRAHFLPIRTDLDRWRTFLFFFLRRFKSFRKILLQPTTYVCWRRARWCWCSKRAIDCKPKHYNMIFKLYLYYHN